MSLKGRLGYREIADIFNAVEATRKSGVMSLAHGKKSARLFFEWGELIRAQSNTVKERMGDLLIDRGALTAEEIGRALDIQRSELNRRRLGEILVADLSFPEDEIQSALAAQFKYVVADLLTWDGGSFVFDFEKPEGMPNRFTLSASDFLLEAGIEAGLLVRNGELAKPVTAILLEADEGISELIMAALEKEGVKVTRATSGEAALMACDQGEPSVLVVCAGDAAFGRSALETGPDSVPLILYGQAGTNGTECACFVPMPDKTGEISGDALALFADELARAVVRNVKNR